VTAPKRGENQIGLRARRMKTPMIPKALVRSKARNASVAVMAAKMTEAKFFPSVGSALGRH